MRLALSGVGGVGLGVVDRGGGGRGGGGGGGWRTGVFHTAAATVTLWLVGWSDAITASRAVGPCAEGKHKWVYERTPLPCSCTEDNSLAVMRRCTSGVQVCVAASVAGAEDRRAGVTILGLGWANGQAANLAVCAIHHLHKLTTPYKKQSTSAEFYRCCFTWHTRWSIFQTLWKYPTYPSAKKRTIRRSHSSRPIKSVTGWHEPHATVLWLIATYYGV